MVEEPLNLRSSAAGRTVAVIAAVKKCFLVCSE